VFEIAYTGTAHVRSLFEAALRALMPEFSRAAATGAHQEMRALRRKSHLVIWVAAAPAYVALAAVAPVALPAWLGASFVPAQVPVFEIMLAGSFLSLLGVPTYYYFLGRGFVRVGFYGHVIQSGTSLLLVLASIAVTSRLTIPWVAVSVSLGFGLSTLYLAGVRRLVDASPGSAS
jgi:O-antigen/teichoic acid export membrane protein